ncbi:hypothetical protein LI221_09930 [Faecalimonas umbilicata]|nr:hypothetical protein [Faecalimonas umbilicata]
MKHQGFSYDFTMKELAYFLFKEKKCPKCGGRMEKSKGYRTVRGETLNSSANAFFVQNARIKQYVYNYTCQQCGASYTLDELAK